MMCLQKLVRGCGLSVVRCALLGAVTAQVGWAQGLKLIPMPREVHGDKSVGLRSGVRVSCTGL